jgi:DNA-binding FadR family transcriptional regulator
VVKPTIDTIVDQITSAMIMLLLTNPRGLEELKSARILLEVGLVRLAAERAGPNDIRFLEDAIVEMREAAGDTVSFVAADLKFHEVIAGISGNSLIAAAVGAILGWLSKFRREMVLVKGAEKLTIQEHQTILDAIKDRDPEAAGEAMQRHLSRANELYSGLTWGGDFA